MEKDKIQREVGLSMNIEEDSYCNLPPQDIDHIIDFLKEGKKLGANHVSFYGCVDVYGDPPTLEDLSITLINISLETDIEFKERKEENEKEELIRKKKNDDRDMETYLKLKNKFEK